MTWDKGESLGGKIFKAKAEMIERQDGQGHPIVWQTFSILIIKNELVAFLSAKIHEVIDICPSLFQQMAKRSRNTTLKGGGKSLIYIAIILIL